ncbi:MAG: alpha/beta hydrolase family protein [Solirubrobacteraceae bacterium]
MCELFAPAQDGPHPVAVMVHGGFWRRRYGCNLQWGVARDLADRGWLVWNVEYRRIGDDGGWPATFEDVAAAIDALADEDADLERVVAIGHSAGGQLAVWAAARPGLPEDAPGAAPRVRLTGAIAQAGVLDLHKGSQLSNAAAHELLGGSPDEQPRRYELASPARRLPVGVPLRLVHGARDGDVPLEISLEFAEAARNAGDDCDLVVVDDESHYEHLEPGSRSWKAVVEWLER